jgi:hypothetical protein
LSVSKQLPLLYGAESFFSHKKFLTIIICLLATLLIDISFVRVYDIVQKDFAPTPIKVIFFALNSSLCLFLGFTIIRYVLRAFRGQRLSNALHVNRLYFVSSVSFLVLGGLLSVIVFQMYFDHYYGKFISISFIAISYGTASIVVIRLVLLFMSWYESSHNLIVLLYFISMLLIAFNLIMTALITDAKLTDYPDKILEFVGGSSDISAGRYVIIDNIYQISTIASFFSIWITTAILMNSYRERLVNVIIYWILLSIPLVYFIINFLFRFILLQLLGPYLATDPITFSIVSTVFLSLSLPIGGLTFAIAFWKISRLVSYEINIRTYMVISGWGILLIFSANQATVQTVGPYPPFGLRP